MLAFLETQLAHIIAISPTCVRNRGIAVNHILNVIGAGDEHDVQPHHAILWTNRSLAGHPECDIARPLTSSSLVQYATQIDSVYREQWGVDSPFTHEVWQHIFAMCATYGKPETPVTPGTREVVREILGTLDVNNTRDRCIACFVTLAYSTMQRPGELLALDYEDVTRDRRGIIVRFGKAKNNPECLISHIPVPYDNEPALCPVRRLDEWLEVRGTSDGPLYRPIPLRRILNRRLSKRTLDAYIGEALARAQLVFPRSGPSMFRRGGATDGAAQGRSEGFLRRRTRHRSYDHGLGRYIDPTAMDDSDYTGALVLP
jgi:integrase